MNRSDCVIHEFHPMERWEEREYRPPRRRRRRRQRLLPALLALALVSSFLLGRASALTGRHLKPVPIDTAMAREKVAEGKLANAAAEEPESWDIPVTLLPQEPEAVETPWNLVLINFDHYLPDDFTAPELTQLGGGQAVDSRIYPALQEMLEAARAAGVRPTVCSSFRTWAKQESLYKNKIQRLKNAGWDPATVEQEAARWVARPGTSEHQAGLAVDIVDVSYMVLDHKQETTAAQKWLMAHCAEYGFILRYPSDKSDITRIGYEPWHYRYVGVEAAKAIMEQGICLEEYLAANNYIT